MAFYDKFPNLTDGLKGTFNKLRGANAADPAATTLADAAPATAAAPVASTPTLRGVNPNVPPGGLSAEAQAFNASRAGYTPPEPLPEAPSSLRMLPTEAGDGVLNKVARVGGTALGRGLAAGGAVYNGYQAGKDAVNGNVAGAIDHGTDAIASGALMTPAAPVAAAYLGGKTVGGIINRNLSDDTADIIGGTINQALNKIGLGGDDSAYLMMKARGEYSPTSLRTPAHPVAAGAPTVQNDDDAVNKRLAEMGAGGATQITDANGMKTFTNLTPNKFDTGLRASNTTGNDPSTQAYLDSRNAQERGLQAGYARDNQAQAMTSAISRLASGNSQTQDAPNYDAQIQQALADGRPAHARALLEAKSAAARDAVTTDSANKSLAASLASTEATKENSGAMRDQARAQLAGVQAQREFEHNKFMVERDDKLGKEAQEQRIASENQAMKSLEAIAPRVTDKDGKVSADPAFVQNRMADINHTIGTMADELAKTNPAQAKTLRDKGWAALGTDAQERLIQLASIKQRAEETRGLMPGKSDGPTSNDLRDYLPVGDDSKNSIFYDTVSLRGGGTVRKANLTHRDPSNFILPDVGNPTTTEFGLRK